MPEAPPYQRGLAALASPHWGRWAAALREARAYRPRGRLRGGRSPSPRTQSPAPGQQQPTMLQLMQLKQPKKIHSEQSNGLLRVLRVGPPRESIMGHLSVPTLWRMRAVCQSCRAWGCEALTALPRPIVIAGVTFPDSRCPATGALFALLLLSVWCAPPRPCPTSCCCRNAAQAGFPAFF